MSVMIKKGVEDHKDAVLGKRVVLQDSVFFFYSPCTSTGPFVVQSTQWNECAKSEVA